METFRLLASIGSSKTTNYLTTLVNTGATPSSTVTYTCISPAGGICGPPSRGRSTAVNKYSVPPGIVREATLLALA